MAQESELGLGATPGPKRTVTPKAPAGDDSCVTYAILTRDRYTATITRTRRTATIERCGG